MLGGGAEAASNNGRWVQWAAAWPLVKSNPITGHGFGTGGDDIGSSIDSYVISLLVETGVPGFLFFTGLVLLPIWYGVRAYLTDLSEWGRHWGRARLQLRRLRFLQTCSVGAGKQRADFFPVGHGYFDEARI